MNDKFNRKNREDSFSPYPFRSREQIRETLQRFISVPSRPFSQGPDPITGFWLLHNSRWPYMRLDIEFDPRALLSEAETLLQSGVHHLQNGSFDWLTFPILDNRGFTINDSVDLLESLYDMEKFSFSEGSHENLLAWKLALSLPLEKILAVQYFVLKPGGIIIPHADTDDQGLTRFNFCLTQPLKAYTYFECAEMVPYVEGSCFIFDPSVKHAAVNDSAEPRYYLQVSGMFGYRIAEMYKLLEASYRKYYTAKAV